MGVLVYRGYSGTGGREAGKGDMPSCVRWGWVDVAVKLVTMETCGVSFHLSMCRAVVATISDLP